jgi:hypothetical protein
MQIWQRQNLACLCYAPIHWLRGLNFAHIRHALQRFHPFIPLFGPGLSHSHAVSAAAEDTTRWLPVSATWTSTHEPVESCWNWRLQLPVTEAGWTWCCGQTESHTVWRVQTVSAADMCEGRKPHAGFQTQCGGFLDNHDYISWLYIRVMDYIYIYQG